MATRYMLKRMRMSIDDHPPVGTYFVQARGHRGSLESIEIYYGIYYITGYTRDDATRPNFRLITSSLGNMLTKRRGILWSSQEDIVAPSDAMYQQTWGSYYMPQYIYALVKHETCMFDSGGVVFARRIGPTMADRSKAHQFSISLDGIPSTLCSTDMELLSYYHVLTLEDAPTCKRCQRLLDNA